MKCRIAILGDFNPANSIHYALNESIKHVENHLDNEFQCDWISTDVFDPKTAFNALYSGLWIVPGSPYKSMERVIDAIHYTRVNEIPTLGTCAGFQHMLIEFARNVCGLGNADHEETNPNASNLVISKLACSLVGKEEDLTIVDTESKLFELIKKRKFKGEYHCNYGFNNDYGALFKDNGCFFTVLSPDGKARAFEIKSHPFFMGTLFQTPLASSYENPNPIISDFISSSLTYSQA